MFTEMQGVPVRIVGPLLARVIPEARPEMAREPRAERGRETFHVIEPLPQQDVRLGVEFGGRQGDECGAIFGAHVQLVGGTDRAGPK